MLRDFAERSEKGTLTNVSQHNLFTAHNGEGTGRSLSRTFEKKSQDAYLKESCDFSSTLLRHC